MSPLSFVVPMEGSPFYQTGKRILDSIEAANVEQHAAVQWMVSTLQISETKAADYIRGETRLPKTVADKLAERLGVTSDWLRTGTGDKKQGLRKRQRQAAGVVAAVGAPTVRTARALEGAEGQAPTQSSLAVAAIPPAAGIAGGSACVRCLAAPALAGSAVCTPCAHAYASEAALVAAAERRQVQYLQLQLSNANARVQEVEAIAASLINRIAGHAVRAGLLTPVRPVDPDLAGLLLDNVAAKAQPAR